MQNSSISDQAIRNFSFFSKRENYLNISFFCILFALEYRYFNVETTDTFTLKFHFYTNQIASSISLDKIVHFIFLERSDKVNKPRFIRRRYRYRVLVMAVRSSLA